MHNNSPPKIQVEKPPKEFFTVIEAAVLLAKAEGAKSANSPLIQKYTQLIGEAIERGALEAGPFEPRSGHSSAVSYDNLKQWIIKNFPNSTPAFLFGKNNENRKKV